MLAPEAPSGAREAAAARPRPPNWTDVTPGGSCAGNASKCMYKDNTSGLTVTKNIASADAWDTAVQACNSSTYGSMTAGTWRLPTQKELMQLYNDGLVSLASSNYMTLATMTYFFWTSTTESIATTNAWIVDLANGYSLNTNTKTNTNYVLCVSP